MIISVINKTIFIIILKSLRAFLNIFDTFLTRVFEEICLSIASLSLSDNEWMVGYTIRFKMFHTICEFIKVFIPMFSVNIPFCC